MNPNAWKLSLGLVLPVPILCVADSLAVTTAHAASPKSDSTSAPGQLQRLRRALEPLHAR
jgi:hypothetical protein